MSDTSNTLYLPPDDKDFEISKHSLLQKLKSEIRHKFKRNDVWMLRTKSKSGSERVVRTYQIKQIIWSMNNVPVQALVVKQLSGEPTINPTLSHNDCHMLHIKYEQGLQVLSMKLNWIKTK